MAPEDHLVRALDRERNVRLLVCTAGGVARRARELHALGPASAATLAQGLTAGLLLAGALEKGQQRINLQIWGQGPIRTVMVDAAPDGNVRGYVRESGAPLPEVGARFDPRTALGSIGSVQVLRDLGEGEFYRGVVPLQAPLAGDLEHYFLVSEQVETTVALEVVGEAVAGLLVQRLPGEEGDIAEARELLQGGAALARALDAARTAHEILASLWPGRRLEIVADYPVRFACRCSRERVVDMLALLGADELSSMRDEGKAEITCQFCSTRYEVAAPELAQMHERLKPG